MKRIFLTIILLTFVLSLTACKKEKAFPLSNPEIELFEIIYQDETYSIYERIDQTLDDDVAFTMIAYTIGEKTDSCIVGSFDLYNYRFFYDEQYYDIVEANKLGIFTCTSLNEVGIFED